MQMPSRLDEIGLRHGTDKSSAHHDYLRHYELHFGLMKAPIQSLLEIGVYDGASLRMWRDFLPDAHIICLDIDPRCKTFEGGNATVELCDQSDPWQLTAVGVKHGPFDLIIDDGSHIWSHQILTFETLVSFLAPGGLYIMEDIDTSFGHFIEVYGKDSTISAAQYLTKIMNYLVAATAADMTEERDLRIRTILPRIDSITFIRKSALIRLK
jgi:predicted O-methyltransferase YrrM